jgi:aminopeptidase N
MRRRQPFAIAASIAFVAACSGPAASTTTAATTTSATTTSTTAATATSTSSAAATTAEQGAVAGADGIGDEYYPTLGNGGYDVTHYDLDLAYQPSANALTATTTVEATATENLTTFDLDFDGFDIPALTVDGEPASFERVARELIVKPAVPLAAGDSFTVVAEYEGFPGEIGSVAFPRMSMGWRSGPDGEQYVVAEPDAANSWFPANDHPLDKATFHYRVTVPEGWSVGSTGAFIGTEPGVDGTITYEWEMAEPMATYLATVVIGEGYELVPDPVATAAAGIPVRNFLPADLVEGAPDALSRTGEMIAAFEEFFGPYPFDQYGIAVVGDFPAALENQTMSIFGRGYVESPIFEYVLAHELAHQWFGDSVSVGQWKDVWLNEGFATYAELLWIEHSKGRAAYDETLANRREAAAQADYPLPGEPPPHDLFNGGVYQLGGLLLADLREEIGDDNFFDLLRTYTDRYADSNAVTEDFIALAEEISETDLGDFFATRLYSG